MYNVTGLSNCADYICWFQQVNTASRLAGIEILSSLFVIGSFLLAFVLTSRNNSGDSLLVSSFFATIVSLMLALAQLLNPVVFVMCLILLGASVVMK